MLRLILALMVILPTIICSGQSEAAWKVKEKKDDFTDKVTSIYAFNIDEPDNIGIYYACYGSGKSAAYIRLKQKLPDFTDLEVKYRIGSQTAVETTWRLGNGLILSIDDPAFKAMMAANPTDNIVVGFKLFDGSIYKFGLEDFKSSVAEVIRRCPAME